MLDGNRILILVMLAACSRSSDSTSKPVTAESVTAALEGAYGVHAGQRRNHAKGTCAVGTFVGIPTPYSRSRIFSGQPLPVVARFSLAGGDPDASDTERSPRGMALELRLPDGGLQHFTMINTPMFFAATPRTFQDKMRSLKRGPDGKADPTMLVGFMRDHRDAQAQAKYLLSHLPPPSYANAAYYGIHTFHFVDRGGRVTPVRFRFVPDDGELAMSNREIGTKPPSFLESVLIARLARGPAKWQMLVSIGEPDDTEIDPTVVWPSTRKEVAVGTLTLTSAMPQHGALCEPINYDPLVMTDGIAPSKDPVLLFRSPSYRASFERRSSGD